MKEETYKYNAFISYRHSDLDKYVAENLHKLIETYKMPKSVVEKYNITDNNIRRVFRDQDELPLASNLEDPIIEALKQSKFLIVICSPRLKESIWCKKEIENFIKLHGRQNILCVLVEGEPKDSFPEELLYYEEKVKTSSGKEKTKKVHCEPLAMDVRGKSKKEIYSKLKSELIRIIAPMYNLDYDDIKRRHEERELKRKANRFKIIAIVSLIFAVYSFSLFFNIYRSSKQLKYNQAINLAKEAHETLLKDNRRGAVEKAYQSVTKYNNIKMPITTQGIYELTDSLGLYNLNTLFYPIRQLDTVGSVTDLMTNKNRDYLLSRDSSNEIVLWDLDTFKRKSVFSDESYSTDLSKVAFLGDSGLVYANNNNEVVIVDYDCNIINRISLNANIGTVESSVNGKYIAIKTTDRDLNQRITIFDNNNNTNTQVASYDLPNQWYLSGDIYFDEKEENVLFTIKADLISGKDSDLIVFNIKDNKVLNKLNLEVTSTIKIIFNEDFAIILNERKNKPDYTYDGVVTKYNYLIGKVDYQKEFKKIGAKDIKINLLNNSNKTLMFITNSFAYLLNYDTGTTITEYPIQGTACDCYTTDNHYLLFSDKGYLHFLPTKSAEGTIHEGLFNCNLDNYMRFVKTKVGFIAYVAGDNRIIVYGNLKNDELKDSDYEEKEHQTLTYNESEQLINEYNPKKKSLLNKAFYSDDKSLVFFPYYDNKLEIYNTQTKQLIKEIEIPKNCRWLDTYLGKTPNGEHLISTGLSGYILNKDFDLIASVPNLCDYENEKLILKNEFSNEHKYSEIKIYSEKEIINKGKEYLEQYNN